jgi:protease I
MKRFIIPAIMLIGFSAVCVGQHKPRSSLLKIIQLPSPKVEGQAGLEQLLTTCESAHQFTSQPLDYIQMGQLAWAGRNAMEPQPQADYPIKLYFAAREGVLAYTPRKHCLEETLNQDIRGRLAEALKQQAASIPPCYIIITGSAKELAAKNTKYMLIKTGNIAQNIRLQAAALGLGSSTADDFNANQVSHICRLSPEMEPIYIIGVGYPPGQTAVEETEEETQTQVADNATAKKAVLIIASRDFRDEELFETKQELENADINTVIASTKTGIIKGMRRGQAEAEILVNDVIVEDYDAIIFVGGPGAKEYFDSAAAQDIAQQAKDKKKVLAAICIAPAILANAGVLNGVRATSFSTEQFKLKKAGAKYTGADVERDGLIITANGPRAATQFGKTIVEALAGE